MRRSYSDGWRRPMYSFEHGQGTLTANAKEKHHILICIVTVYFPEIVA